MMNLKDRISDKKGYTLMEVGIIGCIGASIATIIAIYALGGTLGWNLIKKHVNYEDKYYESLAIADKNGDGNLDKDEAEQFFKELGVVRITDDKARPDYSGALPQQKSADVRPSYDSLCKYLESRGR